MLLKIFEAYFLDPRTFSWESLVQIVEEVAWLGFKKQTRINNSFEYERGRRLKKNMGPNCVFIFRTWNHLRNNPHEEGRIMYPETPEQLQWVSRI
jgi:hypothetical protein